MPSICCVALLCGLAVSLLTAPSRPALGEPPTGTSSEPQSKLRGELQRTLLVHLRSIGVPPPREHPAATRAARRHASEQRELAAALRPGRQEATVDLARVRFLLQGEQVADAAVRTLALWARRGAEEATLEAALRQAMPRPSAFPPDHFGLGLAPAADGLWLTLVLIRRTVELDRLPTAPPPGTLLPLRGRVLATGAVPSILYTDPAGVVHAVNTTRAGRIFVADIPLLQGPGRYVLQVLVEGGRGPEVAAQHDLWVGVPPPKGPVVQLLPPSSAGDPASVEATSLGLLNQERSMHGLSALLPHAGLRQVALAHSRDMRARGYLAHVSPDGAGVRQRLRRQGLRPRRWAENLAVAASAAEAHARWMASPAHRRNLLDPGVTHVGVAVAPVQGGASLYVAHVFALPGRGLAAPRE